MSTFEASELLLKALAMYRTATSYQDEGIVAVEAPGLDHRQSVTFETLFVRPSLFRFKFVSPHPYPPLAHITTTAICGLDALGAYMWTKDYDAPAELEACEGISMAVAGATGISSGAAHNICQLLLPEIGGAKLSSLEGLSSQGDATVDGLRCTTLHGAVTGADVEVTLFIDPETLIIPRIDTRFAQFSSQENRRNIRVNEPIEPSRFARPNDEI